MELKELSLLVDNFAKTRDARIEKDKEAAALKAEENELKDRLIAIMRDQKVATVGGSEFVVTHRVKMKPVAQDWSEIYAYVRDNDAFDLLQKRLTEGAVKLRWEDNIVIPGIGSYGVDELSISKRKR